MRYFLTLIHAASGRATRLDLSFLPAPGMVLVLGDVAYTVTRVVVQLLGNEETGVHHSLDVYVERAAEALPASSAKRVSIAEFNA